MSKGHKGYNSRRARDLEGQAKAILALAGATASAAAAAVLGSGGILSGLHYILLGITGSLAGLALLMLQAARRAELRSGLAGKPRVDYTVPRWNGNIHPPRPAEYVPPVLVLPQAAAGELVLPPIPRTIVPEPPVARRSAPRVVEEPVFEPEPVAAEAPAEPVPVQPSAQLPVTPDRDHPQAYATS